MSFNVTSAHEAKKFETMDEAVDYVKEAVRKEAFDMYDNDEIDKYGLEDMLYKLEENIRKEKGYWHPYLNTEWNIYDTKRAIS